MADEDNNYNNNNNINDAIDTNTTSKEGNTSNNIPYSSNASPRRIVSVAADNVVIT